MASRYPSTKVLDYCYNPVRVVIDSDVCYVPCGKCDGCLLHKANSWSMRLGSEIEENRLALFFTLTYSNFYLPTFVYSHTVGLNDVFTCHHDRNIRWNGKENVLRNEDFVDIPCNLGFQGIPATNYQSDVPYFSYSSKRDFQLYLKLLRKDLSEKYEQGFFSSGVKPEDLRFRYFGISEYGETLLRCHIHAVILPCNPEVANYFCYEGLYKSWKMCDKSMFAEHCHFADSGCRGYITQYLTMHSNLPSVYKEKCIRPWRLSSKGYAIGFNHFDEKEVFENIISGVDFYYKNISRLDERFILRYPSDFGNRLFPKCFEYRKKDFDGLYRLYAILWKYLRIPEWQRDSESCVNRLFKDFNSADVQAIKTCCKWCLKLDIHPYTYVYALDMYYYKKSMAALKIWYEWQQQQNDVYEIIKSYQNVFDYLGPIANGRSLRSKYNVFDCFCNGFGLTATDLLWLKRTDFLSTVNQDYTCEVSGILKDMVKMPKFNEKYGFSPNSSY